MTPIVPAWTYYGWNGSAMQTATGPVQPSVNGTNTLRYWSVDQLLDHANEETKSLAFRMDTWPDVRPTPEAPAAMEVTATLVTDSQINIEWTPPPAAASGVDHYEVRTDSRPYGHGLKVVHGEWPRANHEVSVQGLRHQRRRHVLRTDADPDRRDLSTTAAVSSAIGARRSPRAATT